MARLNPNFCHCISYIEEETKTKISCLTIFGNQSDRGNFSHSLSDGLAIFWILYAGCRLKTFILMVKPLKPLFFSEKPLFDMKKPLFSGKAVFQYFCCFGLCPLKCTLGRNSGIFGILWCFLDGRVYGTVRLGMLLDSKKGDRASANSCPQCV